MSALSPRVAMMHKTSTGLRIGIAHATRRESAISADHALIQAALLDRRTALPASALRRVAGAVWRWL